MLVKMANMINFSINIANWLKNIRIQKNKFINYFAF